MKSKDKSIGCFNCVSNKYKPCYLNNDIECRCDITWAVHKLDYSCKKHKLNI